MVTVIDSFEDADISEYSGDTGDFTVQSSGQVYDASFTYNEPEWVKIRIKNWNSNGFDAVVERSDGTTGTLSVSDTTYTSGSFGVGQETTGGSSTTTCLDYVFETASGPSAPSGLTATL